MITETVHIFCLRFKHNGPFSLSLSLPSLLHTETLLSSQEWLAIVVVCCLSMDWGPNMEELSSEYSIQCLLGPKVYDNT